ncbi:MAG: endonuclease/exonuclease/phosphatase family protein [Nocardioides sp.]
MEPEPSLDVSRRVAWSTAIVVVVVVAVLGVSAWAFGVLPSATAGRSVTIPSNRPTPASDATPSHGSTLSPRHPHVRPPLQPVDLPNGRLCPDRVPRIVEVLQLNIHAGVTRYGTQGLAEIAREINAWRPDVVSLNEVDRDAARSGRVDEASYLARATGMHVVFGANLVQADGHRFGNAVLSRFPVRSSLNTRLPGAPGVEPRGLLRARLRVDGHDVDFFSVHLTQGHRSGLPERIRQAVAITHVLAAGHRPTIVAGDLNSRPGTLPVRLLRGYLLDAQEQAGTGLGNTVPEGRPQNRIDYVLYDNHFRPVPGSTQVLASSSDHRAVRSELVLLPSSHC